MPDVAGSVPPPGGDKSFGDLAGQLVDDAKAYARAEIDLAKAIAADKSRSLKVAAILFAAALLAAIAAVTALAVALFVALSLVMNVVLAGLLTFILVGAIAGGLGWLAVRRLSEAL
jgi:hypothetical protein